MSCGSDTFRVQAPSSSLDYGFNWATWPLAEGEVLTGSVWVVEPVTVPPLVISQQGMVDASGAPTADHGVQTVVWITGGVLDQDYLLTNHITTSELRQDERSFILRIREVLV